MYKDNLWGLLGLYQGLRKMGDPEVRGGGSTKHKGSLAVDEYILWYHGHMSTLTTGKRALNLQATEQLPSLPTTD